MTRSWCALVPQKALARAKGRVELPPEERRVLAVAMLRDTVAALDATAAVAHTFVLWDDAADSWALPETRSVHPVFTGGHDLNQAVELGADRARRAAPGCNVVVVPSDLPALDSAELTAFLARAARHGRAFLADAEACGTSILSATGATPLRPAYGPGSRERHEASGAHEVSGDGLSSLRRDVDDLATLGEAAALGCGFHTRSSFLHLTSRTAELEAVR